MSWFSKQRIRRHGKHRAGGTFPPDVARSQRQRHLPATLDTVEPCCCVALQRRRRRPPENVRGGESPTSLPLRRLSCPRCGLLCGLLGPRRRGRAPCDDRSSSVRGPRDRARRPGLRHRRRRSSGRRLVGLPSRTVQHLLEATAVGATPTAAAEETVTNRRRLRRNGGRLLDVPPRVWSRRYVDVEDKTATKVRVGGVHQVKHFYKSKSPEVKEMKLISKRSLFKNWKVKKNTKR